MQRICSLPGGVLRLAFSLTGKVLRARSGTSAVEFAIIAMVLVTCLTSVYDLANMMQQQVRLKDAVRAGGLYAQTFSDYSANIVSAVTNAVPGWTNLTVDTPTRSCKCWDTSANTYTNLSDCTNDCGSGTPVGYLSISASRPFSAIFLTGLNGRLTASHVVRYK